MEGGRKIGSTDVVTIRPFLSGDTLDVHVALDRWIHHTRSDLD